jgi:uncharacterized protein
MKSAQYYIEQLELLPHPEGGHYKETYRSNMMISSSGFSSKRNVTTSIYFLLSDLEKSHLHRIKSDEQWFYHSGETLEIFVLYSGIVSTLLLGPNIEEGESLHHVVPAGAWFGSRVKDQKGYCLVSCVVAPGFDFNDFELAAYKKISREFPAYDVLLKDFCLH